MDQIYINLTWKRAQIFSDTVHYNYILTHITSIAHFAAWWKASLQIPSLKPTIWNNSQDEKFASPLHQIPASMLQTREEILESSHAFLLTYNFQWWITWLKIGCNLVSFQKTNALTHTFLCLFLALMDGGKFLVTSPLIY